jgi:hypothetical protein
MQQRINVPGFVLNAVNFAAFFWKDDNPKHFILKDDCLQSAITNCIRYAAIGLTRKRNLVHVFAFFLRGVRFQV